MPNIVIYTKPQCPYCENAKNLLQLKKVDFKEIRVDNNPQARAEMEAKSQRRTVPQIFINDQAIGGFDDLKHLEEQGKLDSLLAD